jgi:tRNA-dihydrouridine synthase
VPVVANGDIDSPAKAAFVLARTGADAVMIGRAAQGRPWIFREIDHFLRTGEMLAPPSLAEIREVLREHLVDHYAFYGEVTGPRVARKHIGWYIDGWCGDRRFAADRTADPRDMQPGAAVRIDASRLRDAINREARPEAQLALLDDYLDHADDQIAVH